MKKTNLYSFIIIFIFFISCSQTQKSNISPEESAFYKGKYDTAIKTMRDLVKKSKKKDKLLYLMNTGIIFHTKREYKKSNLVFKQADIMAETIKRSLSKQTLAFLLSDRNANYRGENFERVLIKFYIALNYLMLDNLDMAKRYFRKVNFELKNMKYMDSTYKQNLAVRYLDAIVSEALGKYNDARVEYKNIAMLNPKKNILGDRYILAVKENDKQDIQKYNQYKNHIICLNRNLERTEYNPNMGELVIIYEAGRSVKKESRGRLLDDQQFAIALRVAIEVALHSKGATLSTTSVMAMLGTAENPIPIYKKQDPYKSLPIPILLNNKMIASTTIWNDYSNTAIHNFNDNYPKYISKNVASIALKIVLASIAANELSKKAESLSDNNLLVSTLGRALIGAGAGGAVASTVKPDLRCWTLLPSNFQIVRFFLEPGDYNFNFNLPNRKIFVTDYPDTITIQKGKVKFINFRTF